MLEESDTYLMILEKGEQRAAGRDILLVGEERLGTADESVRGFPLAERKGYGGQMRRARRFWSASIPPTRPFAISTDARLRSSITDGRSPNWLDDRA